MGLDNGIYVVYDIGNINRYGDESEASLYIPYYVYDNTFSISIVEKGDRRYLKSELVYWRKWWAVRNEIVNSLAYKYNTNADAYRWTLDKEDLYEIMEILRDFDSEDKWDSEYWSYYEDSIKEQIEASIASIKKIINMMNRNEGRLVEVYFYDSY